ncbi:MAG: hypothetical protein ACLGQW_01540 [Acidobacteriota bacterium]
MLFRNFACIASVALAIFVLGVGNTRAHDKVESAFVVAENIKKIVVSADVQSLIKLLPRQIQVVDRVYSRKEIVALLRDNGSWLYTGLFSEYKGSVRSYFLAAENIRIELCFEKETYLIPTVLYRSSSVDPFGWKRCHLRYENGRWFLDDLFTE